jgi:two-component system phosphate regulon sensor histidine kinase PhoR
MKNDFIGNMTHELKTPISTIALSSEVLCETGIGREPERLQNYARIIRTENDRLRTQVERVLQLATLDRDHLSLRRENVDLHRKIQEVEEAFRLQLQERDGRLTLHLQNVLFNLVDNALKYSKGRPMITVRTLDDGRWLRIEVSDKGIGMPRDVQRRIFERFYRAHTGNVHDVKGFGLGLHYVQQIVHAHDGRVEVESRPGDGSTFIVKLPYRANTDT